MNILLTRHDKIGDFITAVPMAKVLKEQCNAKIIFLVAKVNTVLAKKIDFIDEVITYNTNANTLITKLKQAKIDVSISAYIDNYLGFCLLLAKIPLRIAPATKFAQIFFNKTVRQRRSKIEKTEIMYNLDLLHQFDNNLKLNFNKPLLELTAKKDDFIIIHCGSGGSSDGNLTLNDYIKLAIIAANKINVVFSFGPNDNKLKQYIINNIKLNKTITIKEGFSSLYDFCNYIATCKVFISTSTGPMHLAGLTNTTTLSFFGNNLFASSKRWATVSNTKCQNNYEVSKNYNKDFYNTIENKLLRLIDA